MNQCSTDGRAPPKDGLDETLQRLYATYGVSEVPAQILDLARKVEEAHREVSFADDGDAPDRGNIN